MPPKPGITPSVSSGRPNEHLSEHTRAWHPLSCSQNDGDILFQMFTIANSSPPPNAKLLMAATVGFGPSSIDKSTRLA